MWCTPVYYTSWRGVLNWINGIIFLPERSWVRGLRPMIGDPFESLSDQLSLTNYYDINDDDKDRWYVISFLPEWSWV